MSSITGRDNFGPGIVHQTKNPPADMSVMLQLQIISSITGRDNFDMGINTQRENLAYHSGPLFHTRIVFF